MARGNQPNKLSEAIQEYRFLSLKVKVHPKMNILSYSSSCHFCMYDILSSTELKMRHFVSALFGNQLTSKYLLASSAEERKS